MPPLDTARSSGSSSNAAEARRKPAAAPPAATFQRAVEQRRADPRPPTLPGAEPAGPPAPGRSSGPAGRPAAGPVARQAAPAPGPAGTPPRPAPGPMAGPVPGGQPPAGPAAASSPPAGQSTRTGTPAGASEGDVAGAAAGNSLPPNGTAAGASEGVGGVQRAAFDPGAAIGRLNSDGDQTKISLLVEPSVTVVIPQTRIGGVGANANYGYELTVRQVGDAPGSGAGTVAPGTAPNPPGTATPGGDPTIAPGTKTPQYEVIFDKRMQAALTASIRPPKDSVLVAGGELSLQSADRVVMRFDTKEEATRAVEALRQVAAAETVRDAAAAVPGPVPGLSGMPNNPAGNPMNGASGDDATAPEAERPSASEAGNGPGGRYNPNNLPEIGGETLARQVEPSAADKAFLTEHISGYEQALTGQAFVRADLMLAQKQLGPAEVKGGLGLHGTAAERIIRRVDLPQGDQPGRLTYAVEGQLGLTGRERINVNTLPTTDVNGHVINMQDIADVRTRATVTWDIPADRFDGRGQPFPEADMLSSGQWAHPDEIKSTVQINGRSQPLTDVSRSDQVQVIFETSLRNPDDHATRILGSLGRGDFTDLRGALAAVPADASVLSRTQFVERDGLRFRADAGVDIPVGGAHVTLVGEVGNDDVVARADRRWTGGTPPAEVPPGTAPETPPGTPPGTPGQLVVVPHDGVNLRPAPGTEGAPVGVLQHGTFAQPTGERATDATGREWVEVRSSDDRDRPVQGWVAAEYTAPHPAGAMDATGRINPELEAAGYREVPVAPGDTIWDIARREGTDFQETVALNSDHVIDPNLIFPGDTVYLPGPVTPPAEAPAPAGPAGPAPTPPGGPSGGASGGSGSSTGTSPPGGTSQGGGASPGGASGGPAPSGPPSGGPAAPSTPPGTPPGTSSGTPPGTTAPGASPGTTSPGASSSGASSSGGPAGPGPVVEGAPERTGGTGPLDGTPAIPGRPDLEAVLRDNQVQADPGGMVRYAPYGGAFGSRRVTETEARMLGDLWPWEQKGVRDTANDAAAIAVEAFPDNPVPAGIPSGRAEEWQSNDGHRDAMRHALASAMLARERGADWATRFTTAHEGIPEADQNADREAMDLYNNGIGVRIAEANPDASNEELAGLVQDALDRGELVVIDGGGALAWSDQVPVGGHGLADDPGVPGIITTPNGDS